jgi:hypothetical protein
MTRNYLLAIDGPLLRRQRILLMQASEAAHRKAPLCFREESDRELLEGLVAMLDEIADQAHDRYGIDCLLEANAEKTDAISEEGRRDGEPPG